MALSGLVPAVILPAVKNTDPDVRNSALTALVRGNRDLQPFLLPTCRL